LGPDRDLCDVGLRICSHRTNTVSGMAAYSGGRACKRFYGDFRPAFPFVFSGIAGARVVGWLRPILLVPEGIADRLTPRQLEAVLAHEAVPYPAA